MFPPGQGNSGVNVLNAGDKGAWCGRGIARIIGSEHWHGFRGEALLRLLSAARHVRRRSWVDGGVVPGTAEDRGGDYSVMRNRPGESAQDKCSC